MISETRRPRRWYNAARKPSDATDELIQTGFRDPMSPSHQHPVNDQNKQQRNDFRSNTGVPPSLELRLNFFLPFPSFQSMELSSREGSTCSVIKCIYRKTGQILGQLLQVSSRWILKCSCVENSRTRTRTVIASPAFKHLFLSGIVYLLTFVIL